MQSANQTVSPKGSLSIGGVKQDDAQKKATQSGFTSIDTDHQKKPQQRQMQSTSKQTGQRQRQNGTQHPQKFSVSGQGLTFVGPTQAEKKFVSNNKKLDETSVEPGKNDKTVRSPSQFIEGKKEKVKEGNGPSESSLDKNESQFAPSLVMNVRNKKQSMMRNRQEFRYLPNSQRGSTQDLGLLNFKQHQGSQFQNQTLIKNVQIRTNQKNMVNQTFKPLTQRNFHPKVDIQSYFKRGSGECQLNSELDEMNANVFVLKRDGSKAKTLHILQKYADEENIDESGQGILQSNMPTGLLSNHLTEDNSQQQIDMHSPGIVSSEWQKLSASRLDSLWQNRERMYEGQVQPRSHQQKFRRYNQKLYNQFESQVVRRKQIDSQGRTRIGGQYLSPNLSLSQNSKTFENRQKKTANLNQFGIDKVEMLELDYNYKREQLKFNNFSDKQQYPNTVHQSPRQSQKLFNTDQGKISAGFSFRDDKIQDPGLLNIAKFKNGGDSSNKSQKIEFQDQNESLQTMGKGFSQNTGTKKSVPIIQQSILLDTENKSFGSSNRFKQMKTHNKSSPSNFRKSATKTQAQTRISSLVNLHNDIFLESDKLRCYQTQEQLDTIQANKDKVSQDAMQRKQEALERIREMEQVVVQLFKQPEMQTTKEEDSKKNKENKMGEHEYSTDNGLIGEIQITNQMFEQTEQDNQTLFMSKEQVEDILIGVNFDCLEQFKQMISDKADIIACKEVYSNDHFQQKLKELTKTYRLLINAVHKTQTLGDQQIPDIYLMTAMPTIWNSMIILFDQILAQQQHQFDQKAEELEVNAEKRLIQQTIQIKTNNKMLKAENKVLNEKVEKFEARMETKVKEIQSLDSQIRDKNTEFSQYVNNTSWFQEFKDYLNSFEKQLDLLEIQKDEFLKKSNIACSIIDNDKRIAKRISSSKENSGDGGKEVIPMQNYNKVYSDQVQQLKQKTNFIFHKSKVPFDISNISQDQFEQLMSYFERTVLKQQDFGKQKSRKIFNKNQSALIKCQFGVMDSPEQIRIKEEEKKAEKLKWESPTHTAKRSNDGSLRSGNLRDGIIREEAEGSDDSLQSEGMSNFGSPSPTKSLGTPAMGGLSPKKKSLSTKLQGVTNKLRDGKQKKTSMKDMLCMGDSTDQLSINSTVLSVQKIQQIKRDSHKNLFAKVPSEKKQKLMKKELKNPLQKAMKCILSQGHSFEKTAMTADEILKWLHKLMSEKVKIDIACSYDIDVLKRKPQPFPQFVYDRTLIQYGLYTKSAMNIAQMCQGLSNIQAKNPYSKILMRMIGMTTPPYRSDEVSVVLRSHQFFKNCQEKWIERLTKIDNQPEPTSEQICNTSDGGICSIFEVIDALGDAFDHDKQLTDRLLSTIKPDCLFPSLKGAASTIIGLNASNVDKFMNVVKLAQQSAKTGDTHADLSLEFSKLKISWRMYHMNKSPEEIFRLLDEDESNSLEPLEILNGLKNYLRVYLSREETNKLSAHLDEDGSGDIDLDEFTQKINTDRLKERCSQFPISKVKFIDKMLGIRSFFKDRERKNLFKKFEDISIKRKNNILEINAFKDIIRQMEPEINDAQVLSLYKAALDLETGDGQSDNVSEDNLLDLVTEYKIGGNGQELFSQVL